MPDWLSAMIIGRRRGERLFHFYLRRTKAVSYDSWLGHFVNSIDEFSFGCRLFFLIGQCVHAID